MKGMEFEHPDRIILVITALSEERRSVLPFLKKESITAKSDVHGREYIVGEYFPDGESRPWHIVLPAPTSAGNSKSATETALSLALNPAFVFLLGVAGGFPKKTNMYDVVVAERVYDVDVAKIDPEGNYIPRPDQHKATSVLLSRAKTLQDMGGWQELLLPNLPNEPIEVWIEPIAAGSKLVASSNSEEFKRLLRDAPRAVAVENEGFGVMQAAHEAAVSALVIRGISDLIDNRPIDTSAEIDERVGPDPHKLKAARHAAAFMFALIGRLSSDEIDEMAKEEDEWVDVRLRWEDLKELAKGKRLALQIMEGSPIRDVTGKTGSVEIEFKTRRLVSAFVYAVSLERDLLREMIGVIPDRVDTTIDTSDPDVTRIFAAVRKLTSKDQSERQEGEHEVQALADAHDSLRAFTKKVIYASRSRISREEKSKGSRISFRVRKPIEQSLAELADANHEPLIRVASELILAAVDDAKSNSVELRNFLGPRSSGNKLTVLFSPEQRSKIEELAQVHQVPRTNILQALLEYAVEMRLTDLFSVESTRRTGRVAFGTRAFSRLLASAGLTQTDLARLADVSQTTVHRASKGESVSQLTAMKLLNVLGNTLGRRIDESEVLRYL